MTAWATWLHSSLIVWAITETSGAQHSVGILMPWTANLIGYSGYTSDGALLYAYSGFGARAQMAISLAFAAIQEDDTLLQEVRELTWVWHDDGCDSEKAIYATAQLIKEYGVKGIIGPSCVTITDTIAKFAFYEDVPVIGYSIPSYYRSSSNNHPNLIRTIAPFTFLGDTVIDLMRTFDWKHLFIVYESDGSGGWEGVASSIKAAGEESNITIQSTFFLSVANAGAAASADSFSTAASTINALGYRVILMIGGCESVLNFGYRLYENSMVDGYAIIMMSSLTDMECEVTEPLSVHEVLYLNRTLYIGFERQEGSKAVEFEYNAVNAYYSFEQYQTPPNGTAKRTGPNKGGFNPFNLSYTYASEVEFNIAALFRWENEWGCVMYLYDSILLYARALNYTLSNGMNSTYQSFMSAIPEITPFEGSWRSVEFNSIGATFDRVLEGRVFQLIYTNKTVAGVSKVEIEWTTIASQNSTGFFLLTAKDSILWPGSSSVIPIDFVNATVACNIADLDSHTSRVFASTLTITVSYVYKEGISCNTRTYDFPSDQILKVDQFPVSSVTGVVALMCSCLGTVACACVAGFAVYFRDHSLLSQSNLSLTIAWLSLTLLVTSSPLFFLDNPSDALCQVRSFAVFLPGFMLSSFMLARIYLLACMISSPKKNRGRSYLVMCTFFALCISPVWLLLIMGSAYEPPTSYSEYVQPYNAPLTVIANFGCRNINESVFTAILLYVAMVVLYGFWITSRVLGQLALAASLWKSSKRVWEVRFLTYCTYITLLGQVELLIASLYKDRTGLDHFRMISSVTTSLAASVSLCVIWIPRMAIVLNESMNARDSSDQNAPPSTSNPVHSAGRFDSKNMFVQATGVVETHHQKQLPTHEDDELFQRPQRVGGKDNKPSKLTVEIGTMPADITSTPSPLTPSTNRSSG